MLGGASSAKGCCLIQAYSDDEEPILEKAENAYLVKNGEVETYRRSG